MWSNYHTHSTYCDGKEPLQEYITQAKALKMTSLGFSSHAPLPFSRDWSMDKNRLAEYRAAIDALAAKSGELHIYKGLEVDYIPGVISPSDFDFQLDYTIGSIHFADQFDDGTPWEIDGTHLHFQEGLDKIFKNNIRAAVSRYFELTRQMIQETPPTIVGHLDKVKIQNPENIFFQESDEWYRQEVKKTLALIKDSGVIIEVNTRGIYQKRSLTTYPSPWILEHICAMGIPITISSDAHHPKDLISQFESTASLLLKIGFKKLTILSHGEWTSLDFTEQGISHE